MILAKKPKIFQKSQKTFRKTIDKCVLLWYNIIRAVRDAAMAQLVEHMLGKHEVISSTLISSSNTQPLNLLIQGFIFFKKTIDKCVLLWYNTTRAVRDAAMAQLVEHMLGKHEVISSTLISSSNTQPLNLLIQGFIFIKLLTNAVPFCYTISNIFWRSRNEKTN